MEANKARNTKSSYQPKSANPQFRALVKTTNKYMSLIHHEKNWQTLPKSLTSRVESLVGSINLPCKQNEEMRQRESISAIEKIIREMGLQHIEKSKQDLARHLSNLDMTDAHWAIRVATAQIRRRLGKRVTEDSLRLYDEEAKKICNPLHEKQRLERLNSWTNQKQATNANVKESQTDVPPPVQTTTPPTKPAAKIRRVEPKNTPQPIAKPRPAPPTQTTPPRPAKPAQTTGPVQSAVSKPMSPPKPKPSNQ